MLRASLSVQNDWSSMTPRLGMLLLATQITRHLTHFLHAAISMSALTWADGMPSLTRAISTNMFPQHSLRWLNETNLGQLMQQNRRLIIRIEELISISMSLLTHLVADSSMSTTWWQISLPRPEFFSRLFQSRSLSERTQESEWEA